MNDARLIVPAFDAEPWPTLGPEICDFIEDELVHGPGDMLGQDIELTDELRLFIYRAYEVYPRDHPLAGRRRFKREVLSRRKGVGKTEIAAWLAICEMDPNAPVRTDGWRKVGGTWIPVGRPVRDPYIPMVAVTEEQTEDLAYGAVHAILNHDRCGLQGDYDAGLSKVVHRTAPGKIQPLASAPSARDGARTTFQHFDETHLFTEPRLRSAHKTMQRNIPKRYASDAHSLETTTMYAPGEDSVAEGSHRYAEAVASGRIADATLYFDHRQASEAHDISTRKGLLAAIREASGDAWSFADPEAIAGMFRDPQADENENRRFWLNQARRSKEKWLPAGVWEALADRERKVDPETSIVIGFRGSYLRGTTVLVGCTTEERPHLFVLKSWERPPVGRPDWRTPHLEVEDAIAAAFERYVVAEFDGVPQGWGKELEEWAETWPDQVTQFDSNQPKRMGTACDDFFQAVTEGQLTHDGSEVLQRHLAAAVSEERRGYKVITHAPGDSGDEIAGAVAAVIAYHRSRFHSAGGEPLFAFV